MSSSAAAQSPASVPVPRFRALTAALLLAALLAGAATALGNALQLERVAAALLTAGVWSVGWGVVTGRHPDRFLWVVLLAAGTLGLFFYAGNVSPLSPQSLHVAALLSYGAVAVAAVLSTLRLLNEEKALLLTFSLALAAFASELLIRPPAAIPAMQWQADGLEDPQVGFRYVPNSTAANFYPDNPRGYFEKTDPQKEAWSIETHGGSQGQLEHLPSESGAIRVTIPKLVGTDVFNVKLNHGPFQITKGTRYVLRFRAKADAPRTMNCAVGNSREPWALLGLYAHVDLLPEWKAFEYPFVASESDSSARIFFDLAMSETPVELSDVVLRNETTGKDEPPLLQPARFFVSYRFNSLGFRGADRVVPRPEGTHRILVLGDSFAQGVGVHEQDTFSARLEKSLNAAGATRTADMTYEVINAGVGGYATRQELRSFELFSSKYQPQVVLVTMVFNDDMSFKEEVGRGLFPTGEDAGGLRNLWSRVRQSDRQFDYSDSIAALRELDEATRRHQAKLAVVIFTNDRTHGWDQMATAVTEGLKGTGVPILNLKDALFAGGRQESELFVHASDGHPNEIAHGIAAEAIERFLKTEGLVP
jgi:lysophospholipase L1-like esterase